jgi:regulator of sigma E protease
MDFGLPLLYSIIGTIIIFGAIVTIHEFGHFIVAKLSGMGVHEFSIGFGPPLVQKKFRDTVYALRIIPLGGYVRIAGMEPGDEQAENSFSAKPFFARFATIFAGSAMNFVLAFVLLVVLGVSIGFPSGKTMFGKITPNSPAAEAGIQQGDVVLKINDVEYPTPERFVWEVGRRDGPVGLVLKRDGEPVTVAVTPRKIAGSKKPVLGVQVGVTDVVYQRHGIFGAISEGSRKIVESTGMVFEFFGRIFAGRGSLDGVAGPPGIIKLTSEVSRAAITSPEGMAAFLWVFALLSLNIGLFNLLPIPALDGSRLVFLVIEKLRGKPFDPDKEAMVHMVGLVLLLGLVLLISVKDVFTIFGGK